MKTIEARRARAWVAALTACLASTSALAAADYSLVRLDSPTDVYSEVNAINASGQMVGSWNTQTHVAHATLISNGTYQDLGVEPTDPWGYSGTRGINAAGQVVGYTHTYDGNQYRQRAKLWQNGAMIDLGTLGGRSAYAHAINDAGLIVGQAEPVAGSWKATLWDGGRAIQLATPSGNYENSVAVSINNKNQVVGNYWSENIQHAVLWEDGKTIKLDMGGDSFGGVALDINDTGDIIGNVYEASAWSRPVLWRDGVLSYLAPLGGGNLGQAVAMNNLGQVVGYSYQEDGTHATLWNNGVATDLNYLLDPALISQGWLLSVTDINDAGQIVGSIENTNNGRTMAVLLNPLVAVPEPSTACMLLIGVLLMASTARRKRASPQAIRMA